MKKISTIAAAAIVLAAATTLLTGCQSDSSVASDNLSKEAEQFRVDRQIVFYNGITDKYIAEFKGRCSVDEASGLSNTLAVTCKVGPNKYVKDYLGKSDNVTWFALQSQPVDVSVYHYEVIYKPENIIPDLRIETGKQ